VTNRPGHSPNFTVVRAGNFSIAAARFVQTWADGVPSAAAHRFFRLWPVWAGASLLIFFFMLVLDVPSVGWARELPTPVNGFFQWLTRFGKSDWLLFPLGAFCLVLLLADWHRVSRSIAAAWTEIGLIAGFAFLAIAGSGILVNVFKQLIGRGRPIVFDQDGAFSFLPFQFDYSHTAFPSGHSTTAGALAVVVAVVAPRLRAPVFVICGLVASSRVVVGAHFPSDVVAGFLLGAAFTWFYTLALAGARIGFARTPAGPITARVLAVRKVFKQPRGLRTAIAGLWSAIFRSTSRTTSA